MEREVLRLGEALREERSWETEGVTVLTASVTLPQAEGESRAARRFNRCYRRFCRAYFAYCAHILAPSAAGAFCAARETSAPWEPARAKLDHRVSLRAGAVCSVVCDAQETMYGAPSFRVRRGDVWDMGAGLPMALGEFFPPRTRCAHALLRFARDEALRRVGDGAAYRANWRAMLRRALDTRSFYLTDEGLCFFYPLCALAGAKEGIVTFTMPYDAEKGPFPPEA